MSPRELICRIAAAVVCGACLLVVGVRADDSPATPVTNPPPKLEVTLKKGELIGSEQVQRAFVTSGTNEFLIVVPRGLRMDDSKPQKISFVPSDSSFFLSFRIIGAMAADGDMSQSDACRALVLSQYPGAKILEESSLTAAGRSGPAFDLRWKAPGASERLVRVAFIPSAAGVLEFSMLADSQNSSEGQFAFNALVSGFRSNERGKIEIIRYSGNS